MKTLYSESQGFTRCRPKRTTAVLASAALLLPVLMLAGCAHPQPVYYAPPPPPPPAYSAVERQGFNEGVTAGRRDIARALPPDVRRHPRFRNPPVPPALIEPYRQGFTDGYMRMMRPAPPPPGM